MKIPFLTRWPLNILIIEPRQNGHNISYDKGSRFLNKTTGEEKYRLKYRKQDIKPIPYDKIFRDNRGKHWCILYSPNAKTFDPVTIEDGTIKIQDQDLEFWQFQKMKEGMTKYKKENPLMKFAPAAAVILLGLVVLINNVVILKYANQLVTGLKDLQVVAASINNLATSCGGYVASAAPPA